jgi:hypothetical protein
MQSSVMWHRVALVRTDVSEELAISIFSLLVTANVVSGSLTLSTLKMKATFSSET